jgi:hypothetical protein
MALPVDLILPLDLHLGNQKSISALIVLKLIRLHLGYLRYERMLRREEQGSEEYEHPLAPQSPSSMNTDFLVGTGSLRGSAGSMAKGEGFDYHCFR